MISILHEDEKLLAIDKPVGIASIPEREKDRPSVLAELEALVGQKIFVVHRLDKEVSGVLVFARTAEAHRFLNQQFNDRKVLKTYAALTHGVITEAEGIIDRPVRQFGSGRMGVDPGRGKESRTEFKVIERLSSATLVDAFPITGRRHQIRVHLYSIGHPVAGDPLYGERALQVSFPRLMLHARALRIRHPSGHRLQIESPFPESFQHGLALARGTTTPSHP